MKPVLHPHQRAARVIRLMAWVSLLINGAVGAAVLIPAIATNRPFSMAYIVVVPLVLLAIPISLFLVARGIFAERNWARRAGMAYGVVALFGIPIGTIVGAYVLWQLGKGWPARQPSASDAQGQIEPAF